MILKILPLLIILILLPDYYIYQQTLRHTDKSRKLKCILWFTPSFLLLIFTVFLCSINNFEPDIVCWVNTYLLLIGVLVVPKSLYALFSFLGHCICKITHKNKNYGNLVGLFLALFAMYIAIYGSTIGFRRLNIRHIDVSSSELPQSFDGYKIVQFSDAHVGTYIGSRENILKRAVDSINAQKADAIMFCGDLENLEPSELYPFIDLFSSLKARDGVFSILGNHDYPVYMRSIDAAQKIGNLKEIKSREQQFGWNLLLNEHRSIRRGQDSIIIAGEENDGTPNRFPVYGDTKKTVKGIPDGCFTIILQHDPSAWQKHILPLTNAQLTLSGHTHAMQFELFGWSPASLLYKEWGGLYCEKGRYISVSKGLGGIIPFRFGATGEIVVITLHRTK